MNLSTSDYQSKIDTISKSYYQNTGLNIIEAQIEFTDNIFERNLELASNEKQREFILNHKESKSKINGTTILPEKLDQIPYILISTKTTKNSDQYISTITHELTHLHDFYDIINYYNLEYSEEFYDNKKCCLFSNWSEYHATQIGYSFFKSYEFQNNNVSKEYLLNDILKNELPFQWNILMDEWGKTKSLEQQAYYLMHFLGRFSIWQKWFPNQISIIMAFADDQNVIKIYNFLLAHYSFEKIIASLDEFNKILFVK